MPPIVAQTLDTTALIDTATLFSNANVIINAFAGLVMVLAGFELGLGALRFVLNAIGRLFSRLSA